MADKVYEGLWDCSDCGQTGIRGRETVCPRCKSPQNSVLTPEEDWYLPTDADEITDSTNLDLFDDGPSWNCGHCETLNNGGTDACSHCGQSKDFDDTVNREVTYDDRADSFDVKPDPLIERIETDLERAERAITTEASGPRKMNDLILPDSELPRAGRDTIFYDDIRHDAENRFEEKLRLGELSPARRFVHDNRKPLIIGAAAVAVLVVIGVVFGIVRIVQSYTAVVPGTVTVTALHWERGVEVEEYKTLTQGGWDHPGDARVLSRENRIRDYRKVHDGWRTETYTDYETKYRTETYMDTVTRYRTETYSGTCTRTVSGGNGSFRSESYSCPQTRSVPYAETVQRSRQVPYSVPVQKTRQVEMFHMEPIWNIWYSYQIDRWVTDRWVTATDATSAELVWPKVTDLHLIAAPGDQIGEERVGNERTEEYSVVYVDSKGTQKSDHKDFGLWNKLEKDETVPATYRKRSGDLVDIDWSAVA